jgi:hypothetical protein
MEKQLTAEERALWSRYFLCEAMLMISKEYNAKTWPVKTATEVDAAVYIATFCYVFDVLRGRQKENLRKQ